MARCDNYYAGDKETSIVGLTRTNRRDVENRSDVFFSPRPTRVNLQLTLQSVIFNFASLNIMQLLSAIRRVVQSRYDTSY